MSGRRCKALRAAFRKEHGRAPAHSTFRRNGTLIESEWRRLKKAHRKA